MEMAVVREKAKIMDIKKEKEPYRHIQETGAN